MRSDLTTSDAASARVWRYCRQPRTRPQLLAAFPDGNVMAHVVAGGDLLNLNPRRVAGRFVVSDAGQRQESTGDDGLPEAIADRHGCGGELEAAWRGLADPARYLAVCRQFCNDHPCV